MMKNQILETSFADSLRQHLKKYFANLDGEHFSSNLYDDILLEVEKVLISETMHYCSNIQSKTASMLGMNRNTLRNKIKNLDFQDLDLNK